jgi:uncharacterized membrane protein
MVFKLMMILFVLMLFIGEERGFVSFGALFLNGITMIILVYLIAGGINPYFVSFAASVLITYFTLVYQNGKNIKSISSVISVILVMAVLSFGIMWIVSNSHVGGYSEVEIIGEEATYLSADVGISMNTVMVCVVLIGLLGAVMDTSIAITTAVYEVHRNNNELGLKELMQSGKNVGRDILGTTANTLFFAGMGEVIMLFIWLFRMNGYTFSQFLNSKAFFQEMLIIIVSNIGCVIIIPVSVLVISYMIKRPGSRNV